MSVFDKATSTVLDKLWDDDEFRDFFNAQGHDLSDLARLIPEVFTPAYLAYKESLRGGPLELLEAQVTEVVLAPLYERASFREMWEAWDQATRDTFLSDNSELKLAELLVASHTRSLADVFRRAYEQHTRTGKNAGKSAGNTA